MGEVKIEGGYRKPEWRDLVIVQAALLPFTLFNYAKTYHRRYISKEVRLSSWSLCVLCVLVVYAAVNVPTCILGILCTDKTKYDFVLHLPPHAALVPGGPAGDGPGQSGPGLLGGDDSGRAGPAAGEEDLARRGLRCLVSEKISVMLVS